MSNRSPSPGWWSYIISPIIIGAYWYTGNIGWMWAFGALSVVSIVVMTLAGAVLLSMLYDTVMSTGYATSVTLISKRKMYTGTVYQVLITAALIYMQLWVNLALVLTVFAWGWIVIYLTFELAKKDKY